MEQTENKTLEAHPVPIEPVVGIEIKGSGAPESPINMVVPACLGSCSILGMVDYDDRQRLLEQGAQATQIWCHGPRDGQVPGRTICGQPEAAKRQIWGIINPGRNRS